MKIYGQLTDNGIKYYKPFKGGLLTGSVVIINPSEETLAKHGWLPVENINEDGTDEIVNGTIRHYVGTPSQPTEKELREQELRNKLSNNDALIEAVERMLFHNGATDADKQMASERIAMRDELGKLIQTEEGDGTDMNPYKWEDGKAVVTGMWYKTPSDYIWEAVADGVPASETDTNYFDVVGL